MNVWLTCPVCNSEPEITKSENVLRSISKSSAKNIVEIRSANSKETTKSGMHTYLQTQYIIRCSNRECLLHSLSKKFWTHDECYEAWNRRKKESED